MESELDLRAGKEVSEYWRLCEVLTVQQAALLILGCDPASDFGYCERWSIERRPAGYEAVKQALISALKKSTITGEICSLMDTDSDGNITNNISGTVSVYASTVDRDSLLGWLQSRGLRRGFFFPMESDDPDYLNQNHPRYASKLAAAVRAWQAVTDPGNKSPKKALDKWLREHAAEFGMVDDDGNPVNLAVEECSKIANWQPGGGATRTPAN